MARADSRYRLTSTGTTRAATTRRRKIRNSPTGGNDVHDQAADEARDPRGDYPIDAARSGVVFSARKFGIFTIRSTMAVTEGEIRVGSRLEDSSARVTLDATSFTTPVRKRDEHVKGPRLLDVVRHPEIAFRSTELAMVDGKWIVGGVLVCHGAERRVDLDVDSLVPSGDTLVNRAASTLDRREFGVRAMKLVASSLLRIEVEVVAVRATNP